jgi:hypothetical protein
MTTKTLQTLSAQELEAVAGGGAGWWSTKRPKPRSPRGNRPK